ncbi:MAG: type II toxin-antitoxin system RelE/ParE family toxin [Pseudoxanthomonas suwonensis]|nr:type II toxin-antitoxin system RelE/ParE family toxin [Pseudoxanthomonas suwonensis]
MRYRFDLSVLALEDLRAIARFTQARWGATQRNRYLKQIDRVFRSLASNPQMGQACDDILEGYRKFPHGQHVIFYTLPGDDVLLIVRILHAAMDVDDAFATA